ncbi:hypothetical protein [Xanthomonas sp. LMG 12461]|uniref:hypothetical protein n=1 Tax=Xanthomonas sp. LMG 12461 TaxID=2014543 RepID=UPI001264DC9D|nr:hypothetical protein [Xanthomonas sp. LMG 12461]
MSAKLPYAWFPTIGLAAIRRRKVDKWAVRQASYKPYFPTWEEAHSWMQKEALTRLAVTAKRLEQDRRHLERVLALTAPSECLPTSQHPNNQPLADPLGSEDARAMPNDLHDV